MLRVLEITWMMITILSLITGLYITFTRSIQDSYVFLLISAGAGFFYYIRRRQREDSER